jgi:choloylglycine hydrolase
MAPEASRACTTFVLRDSRQLLVGHNLDWHWERGLLIVNPRAVAKSALVEKTPARWTSQYASVTFNQFGQERPFGGMNEAGLVVEQMTYGGTLYPAPDDRPAVDLLQWAQYQLDCCRTVAEVIATDRVIRIERPTHPGRIHYLVCDAEGDCAVIEFLAGRMACYRGDELPYAALSNDTYTNSAAFVRAQGLPGPAESTPSEINPLTRFRWAAGRSAAFRSRDPEQDVDYAFRTLRQVAQGRGTVWSIVYEPRKLKIHFFTQGRPQRQTLEFVRRELARRRTVQFADLQSPTTNPGGVTWEDLTEARHRAYLEAFLGMDELKRRFADLTPIIEPTLRTIRGFTGPPDPETGR